MARRSNYADKPIAEADTGAVPEHRLVLGDFRGFTPSEGENDQGTFGGLGAGAKGDWSWRPWLSNTSTPTYRPLPHARACCDCGLTSCLSLISHIPVLCA